MATPELRGHFSALRLLLCHFQFNALTYQHCWILYAGADQNGPKYKVELQCCSEMAPPKLRGRFNQLYQLVLTFFILVAQVINLIINVTGAIRWVFALKSLFRTGLQCF